MTMVLDQQTNRDDHDDDSALKDGLQTRENSSDQRINKLQTDTKTK